jgi:adenylate cyclase class 2
LRTAGKRAVLTFKGAKQKSRSFKVREEFETGVANRRETRKILAGLGLQPVFTYRKHRTIFRKDKLVLTVDETSVGNFIEIEGKRHEIVRFAKSLGYSRADFITASYMGLILAAEKDKKKA